MGRVILIEAFPRRPSDGATVAFRVAGGDLKRANYFGNQWYPAVTNLPRMVTQLGFNGHVFGDGAVATIGELQVAWTADLDPALGYLWANAAVTIKTGDTDDADGAFTTLWSGRAANARYATGRIALTLADPAEELRRPLLDERFAGTGDLEGDADLEGKLKPRAWGECEGVPCLLIDSAYNIWMAADDSVTFGTIRDGGVAYSAGPSVADLAALRAASITDGAVATCPSLGLVRPWTAPKLKLTADITVGLDTAADIAEAMVTARTGISFATGTVAAFNAAQGNAIGTWINDDHAIAEELDRIFSGLGSWWKLNADQEIELGQFAFGAPAQTFEAEVADINRMEILVPSYRRLVGYRRNFDPHSDGEIAAAISAGDVDGLGGLATKDTADWSSDITGAEKPEDNATVDTRYPTQNMLGTDAGPEQTLTVGYDYQGFLGSTSGMPIATLGLEVGDQVSGSMFLKKNSGAGTPIIFISFSDGTGTQISTHLSTGTTSSTYVRDSITATIPANTVYIRFRATYSGGTTNYSFKQAMLNAGGRALPFEQPPTRVARGEVEEGADVTANAPQPFSWVTDGGALGTLDVVDTNEIAQQAVTELVAAFTATEISRSGIGPHELQSVAIASGDNNGGKVYLVFTCSWGSDTTTNTRPLFVINAYENGSLVRQVVATNFNRMRSNPDAAHSAALTCIDDPASGVTLAYDTYVYLDSGETATFEDRSLAAFQAKDDTA